jgi:hypothetical protein
MQPSAAGHQVLTAPEGRANQMRFSFRLQDLPIDFVKSRQETDPILRRDARVAGSPRRVLHS